MTTTDTTWPERDMLEAAWGIIANVDVGDWARQRPEWQRAAARWRDAYHRKSEPSSGPFVELLPAAGGEHDHGCPGASGDGDAARR